MRLAELRTTDGRTLVLHPRLAIVEADETTRSSVLEALSGALSGGSPAAGFFEVHGIVLDLDRASFALLEVDPQLPLVLGPDDIPAEAFGPSGARRRAADDVATKQRELVDARKQQAQGALEVVTAVQAALRAATIGRDEAKARLDEAEHELDAAIASREAAERTVDALADANDTPLIEAEDAAATEGHAAPSRGGRRHRGRRRRGRRRGRGRGRPLGGGARGSGPRPRRRRRARGRRAGAKSSSRLAPRTPPGSTRKTEQRSRPPTRRRSRPTTAPSKRFGGNAARRRLDEAKSAERAVLDRLGLDSYSDFLLRSSMGATDPSAELRLEIARTELVEAEAALSAARSRAEAVPAPPPPRPVAAKPKPPTAVAIPVVAPEPLAAKPPVAPLGDGAARLAAAQRARDDAVVAESTAQRRSRRR